jgi:hypothetical protein
MRARQSQLLLFSCLLVVSLVALGQPAAAQNASSAAGPTGAVKTDTKILYHNGPVVTGSSDVYVVWYGCWDSNCPMADTTSQFILTDFLSTLGSTPYFQINLTYPNCCWSMPSGGLFMAAPPSIDTRTALN